MECDICLLEWDSNTRIPRLLNCGHTFCELCLRELLIKTQANKKKYTCPTCLTDQNIHSFRDINSLIKNFNLLRIAEKVDQRKTLTTSGKELLLHSDNSLIKHINNLQHSPVDLSKLCSKHHLPYHSYAVGTNILLCKECLKETKLSNLNSVSNIITEVRTILDSNAAKISLLKNQIEHLQLFFESYLNEFEKANKKKIEELFNYFTQVIQYCHNNANQMLYQCLAELKQQVDGKLKEINELLIQLNTLDKEVAKYANESNYSTLLMNMDRIRQMEKKLTNFINYDLEFDLLTMNIGLNEDNKDILVNAIEQAYHLDVEFLLINNSNPTISHIVKSDTCWPCLCGDLSNEYKEIKCQSCGLYRRFETINCFYSNPGMIPEEELAFVSKRKKAEEEEYQALNFNSDINDGVYYAIDAGWFNDWQDYLSDNKANQSKDKRRHSDNILIGVLPPGPIRNWNLMKAESELELRQKLIKNKDYYLVKKSIWLFLLKNYNGRPEIQMVNPKDIYDTTTIVNYSITYLIKDKDSDNNNNHCYTLLNTVNQLEDENSNFNNDSSLLDEIIDNYDDDIN